MADETDASPWPDMPRVAFIGGGPSRWNAAIGWLQSAGDMARYGYADGYRRAAELVFEAVERRAIGPDHAVFPMAFLWRHHVELMLKFSILRGQDLNGEEPAYPRHHSLTRLWDAARPYIEELGEPDAPELTHVEAAIRELDAVDCTSTRFRYPPDVHDNPLQDINLQNMHEAMQALANFLSAVLMAQEDLM